MFFIRLRRIIHRCLGIFRAYRLLNLTLLPAYKYRVASRWIYFNHITTDVTTVNIFWLNQVAYAERWISFHQRSFWPFNSIWIQYFLTYININLQIQITSVWYIHTFFCIFHLSIFLFCKNISVVQFLIFDGIAEKVQITGREGNENHFVCI